MRNWLQPNLLAQAPKKQTALTVKHLMLKELGSRGQKGTTVSSGSIARLLERSREKSSITLMETG